MNPITALVEGMKVGEERTIPLSKVVGQLGPHAPIETQVRRFIGDDFSIAIEFDSTEMWIKVWKNK